MKAIILLLLFMFLVPKLSAQETKPVEPEKPAVINGKAISLPKPSYPLEASRVNASGTITVKILTDEEGNVIEAKAQNGHPALREAAEKAALQAKFSPTLIAGKKVKVSGNITYNFVGKISEKANPSYSYKFTWWNFGVHIGGNNFSELERDADWIKIGYPDASNKLVEIILSTDKDKLRNFGNTFQTNLVTKSISEWEFNAGLSIGTILENNKDDVIILRELASIKNLADSPNIFASKTRIEKLKELALFSNFKALTAEQKNAITDICYTIY
jgi:TonB family protein